MSLRKLCVFAVVLLLVTVPLSAQKITCPAPGTGLTGPATVTASIAAINQPFWLNRYGASIPYGMMYALTSDVIAPNGGSPAAGNAQLRPTKRPRPIVLRVRQGDCLQITLYDWLQASTITPIGPLTANVSLHVNGMELVNTSSDDGSFVGANSGGPNNMNGVIAPGQNITYTLYASEVGAYLAYSQASVMGGTSNGSGQISSGLFGSVIVEPASAEMYRSQVSAYDFSLVSRPGTNGGPPTVPAYTARFPYSSTDTSTSCKPILAMVALPASGPNCTVNTAANPVMYYTDLTAIITGPNQGPFTANGQPEFNPVSEEPNRTQPYREFAIHYHEALEAVQAFPYYYWTDPATMNSWNQTLGPGQDQFCINYGAGGIGTEILANRLNVGTNAGPSGANASECVECKFEEFFLTSWAVGDPAMIVDVPANASTKAAGQYQPNGPLGSVVNALVQCALNAGGDSAPTDCAYGTASGNVPPFATGRKATAAYFSDDPSNVYHSYLNDHVIFRILHAGGEFTHVHHQHAHQWLHSPNSPNGSYLDSQLLSPGAAFTLEMVYNGSGNRNKTAGDSIFHCHFYPHFAAGMWSLWRVHDVFESGTALNCSGDCNGPPAAGARALPDGEIAAGTPIPAIVPIPTVAEAPLPAYTPAIVPVCTPGTTPCTAAAAVGFQAQTTGQSGNPGYPFFVPGVAGHRPPRPPLDVACETVNNQQTCYDGGLQRHVIVAGTVTNEQHNQWDFSKDNFIANNGCPSNGIPTGTGSITAQQLPENGTPAEQAAMTYMGTRNHSSYSSPSGTPGYFVTNGLPRGPQPGAPYADPAVDDAGNAVGTQRLYKAADIQTDIAFNKKGWHYPQQRFITLWGDVAAAVQGGNSSYTPQPFFFRANSTTDFITFWQMNLVPSYYELDDYQVRTPTDILGQHIHLVKFDVLASDGAANGFNYEDGTLSPDEVRDRIGGIRNANNCTAGDPRNGTFPCPVAKAPPIAANPPSGQCWMGAQVTVQRWYADETQGCVDGSQGANCNASADRTLRTVFTHDHFGPSTHQQTGLYAGLLVEPTGSTWTDPVSGTVLGSNPSGRYNDGGPTSWQAIINGGNPAYREFALEFQDLTHAYLKGSRFTPTPYTLYPSGTFISSATPSVPPIWGWPDCANQVNGPNTPTATSQATCVSNNLNAVLPSLIDSGQQIGTMSLNYRNEPLPIRIAAATPQAPNTNAFAADLGHAFESITRADPDLNTQPTGCFNGSTPPCTTSFQFPPALPGAQPTDPYTPILQAYQGDKVQIRILVGAHFFNHNFGMYGIDWLFEPSNPNSGWRDNQAMGISEHFENLFTVPSTPPGSTPLAGVLPFTDYLYRPGSGVNDAGQGIWGILRAYTTGGNSSKLMSNLLPAPNNASGGTAFNGSSVCPSGSTQRTYSVAAINSSAISYNNRDGNNLMTLQTPIVYVPASSTGTPLTTAPANPLVLRANAGDCINVTLFNQVSASNSVFTAADSVIGATYQPFNTTYSPYATVSNLFPSTSIGLHAQMVTANAATQNGINVGFNPANQGGTYTTAQPGKSVSYQWYAGNVTYNANGSITGVPIEFGSANLIAADPIEQQPHGAFGALVIEPPSTIWCNTTNCSGSGGPSPAGNVYDTSVTVYNAGARQYNEFVAMFQDNIYLSTGTAASPGSAAQNRAVNFGSEPMAVRYANQSYADFNDIDVSQSFSDFMKNASTNAEQGAPRTPVFTSAALAPVRFRLLHPDGVGGFPDNVFTLHGHVWQEEPYLADGNGNASAVLGVNPLSQWMGSRDGFGPGNHFDLLLPSAGGPNGVTGDYLYTSFPVAQGTEGAWGLFTVGSGGYGLTAAVRKQLPKPAVAATTHQAADQGARFLTPQDRQRLAKEKRKVPPPRGETSH